MRAITVVPLQANSIELSNFDEPDPSEGSLLVETASVGVCGTDAEIVSGGYGWAPPGHKRLILGHESLGRVLEAPAGAEVKVGDLVVGIVRRPDPVPCYPCSQGQWDACQNGQYTEHGIKELDGFMRDHYRAEPDAVVKVSSSLSHLGVLLEPTTVVAKAWSLVDTVGKRAAWKPKTALIVGAGPIGLLAALLGVQRELDVYVIDRVTSGTKPDLVTALGATYKASAIADLGFAPDIIIECTGVPKLMIDAAIALGVDGTLCLAGVSPANAMLEIDAGSLARSMVLGNKVIVGSVNANRGHYEQGALALANANPAWLERLITRRVPMERFKEAFDRSADDVKVVIDIAP